MRIRGAVLEEIGRAGPYARTRPISVGDLDLDPPGPGEVLVRIEAAGVCHSDLSVVNGQRPRPTPMLLGHEAAGRVVECGEGVDDLSTGQQVVLVFVPSCGRCEGCASNGRMPCRPGSAANGIGELLRGGSRLSRDGAKVGHHLGVSAFASHAVVDRGSIVPLAEELPPSVAALLGCAALTGGGAVVNAARVTPDDSVAVVGLGGVGLAAVLAAVAAGAREVVAIDMLPEKRERAIALGASRGLSPDEARAKGLRADAVIEAAGAVPAFETAFAATAPGGRMVSVGLAAPGRMAQVSPLDLVAEARTVIGSYLGSSVPARDVPMYADWWRAGRFPIERLVSAELPLEEINEAMDALESGAALRQIIVPGSAA